MDIGTAKPTAAERAEIPHHLIDIADPSEEFTVVRFREACDEALAAIEALGDTRGARVHILRRRLHARAQRGELLLHAVERRRERRRRGRPPIAARAQTSGR